MLEQIKQSLDNAEGNWYERNNWLYLLIGEVERQESWKAISEMVQRENKELRKALEDVADYQHRWSDKPIFEVQKIARQALERTKP